MELRHRWALFIGFACLFPLIAALLGFSWGSPAFDGEQLNRHQQVEQFFYHISGSLHHALLEWSAVSVAFITAIVSFLHYRLRRDITIPILGCALLCAGFMDAFHTLAATRLIEASAPNEQFIPFTWALSRSFNAIIMIIGVSVNIWLYYAGKESTKLYNPLKDHQALWVLVRVGTAFLVFSYLIIHVTATSKNLPITLYPDSLIKRPFDILPLGLFLFAAALFWAWYKLDNNVIKFTLMLSLMPEIFTQVYMAFGSERLFDHYFNSAHTLKLLAYLCLLMGILIDLSLPNHQTKNATPENITKPSKAGEKITPTQTKILPVGSAPRPLGLQLPIAAFILALTVALVISTSFYFESKSILQTQEVEDLNIESKLAEPLLSQLYQQAANDLRFISQIPALQTITMAQQSNRFQADFNSIETIFKQLLDNKPAYAHLSFISAQNNKKIVSVISSIEGSKQVDNIEHHSPDDLPTKVEQFKINKDKNIHFAPIALKRKNKVVIRPIQPILQSTIAIYHHMSDELLGLLVLDINFSNFVQVLKASGLSQLNFYITNQYGDFIYHPEEKYIFGFDLGHRHLIQQTYPQLGPLIEDGTLHQGFSNLENLQGVGSSAYYRRLDFAYFGVDEPMLLILKTPDQKSAEKLKSFRHRSLLIGLALALMALALAVLSSRRVVSPLITMTNAVKQYEETGALPSLPTNSSDEFGVLARSFHNLLYRINNALAAQKASANRLQETSNKLEAILSSAADAIVTINAKGEILSFNTAAERIFGLKQNTAVGKNVSLLMPSAFAEQHDTFLHNYLTSHNSKIIGSGRELTGKRADGSEFPMLIAISEVETPSGLLFTGIVRDISEQKQDEAAIQSHLSLLKSILESTDNGILVTNEKGKPIHHNSRFAQMWCVTEHTIADKSELLEHMSQQLESQKQFFDNNQMLAKDPHSENSILIHFKDGRVFEQSSKPMMVSSKTEGRVWSYRDITTEKHTEQALIDAKETAENVARYKSEFLASMSHEIRTPMNGVLGMLGLLQHSELNRTQAHHAQLARNSAESLLTIINDILDFSKVDAGKLDLEIIEYNLASQLGDFAESVAHKAQENNIELILDVTGINQTMVKGDPGRLRQILNNLVGNALKFTHQGEVKITAKLTPIAQQQLKLDCEVTDTGIGIENSKLEMLFDSFTQVDASTTRQYGGTGLGLAIVKKLCRLMGGDISVASEPNKGSTFSFHIELQDCDKSQQLLPKVSIQSVPILVVDDNNTNLEVLSSQLQSWGAEVTQAKSGEQAIEILAKRASIDADKQFKVAYLDMQMPTMDGLTLGKKIRSNAEYDNIQLVMMTSMSQRGDAKKLADLGFSAYFPKPTTTSDLFDSLAVVLEGGEALKQASPLVTRHYLKELKRHENQKADTNDTSNKSSELIQFAQNTRILLVEDNFINQAVAVAQIQKFGLNCDVAANGLEALDMLAKSPDDAPYQLIFMDCQMPELDGYQTTKQIRANKAGERYLPIPIIAMTANAMEGDREKCLDAGMNDYISKPIDPEIVEEKLRHFLMG